MSSCLTWRQQRGPRASPGTGRGDGAHQEPLVKVGSAPGARQGQGEPGRRRAGVGSWRGWGRASQLCSRRWPLRLETRRERSQGGVNLGCTGRDSARCGWVVGPCCAPGGRQCGWEPTGSPAGPGRNLAVRGGVGFHSHWGSAPGGGGGGLPSCALGGRHCGWARPFRALLGPQGSASSGRSGGVRTTGQGTGTAWSREPRIPPSVGTFSELPHLAVAERPRLWGQGLYRSTPLLKNLRVCAGFPSSLGSAGSPRDRTLNLGWLAQPCFWHFVGQRALEHLLGWEREGSTNCTLET